MNSYPKILRILPNDENGVIIHYDDGEVVEMLYEHLAIGLNNLRHDRKVLINGTYELLKKLKDMETMEFSISKN